MSTIAVFGVLAGGGAYAASKIGASDIAKNAVRSKHIKENAVKAAKIAGSAVSSDKLADGAVSAPKLAQNAVGSDKLADGAVSAPKLADGAVSAPKLADGAVTGASVQDGSLGVGDLAPGTVGKGVTILSASTADLPTGPNAVATRYPLGLSGQPDPVVMTMPIDATVGDLHAVSGMGIGQARKFELQRSSDNAPLVGCTVGSEQSQCHSTGSATVNAGDGLLLRVDNGPGGATNMQARIGYTLTPR